MSAKPTLIFKLNYEKIFQNEKLNYFLIFIVAAYESPANVLAFIIHNLINNPEIQEKLIEEVDNLYNEDSDFNYNAMSKLPFTEAVVKETFRLVIISKT